MAKVFLKYSFIFDPTDVWSNKDQFAVDLAAFFQSKSLRAEIVQAANENSDEIMVFLEKIENLSSFEPNSQINQQANQSVKKTLAQLAPNKDFQGKFKKGNI